MRDERPRRRKPCCNLALWVPLGLLVLAALGLVGFLVVQRFTGHDMTGLEGVWHAAGDTDRRQGYDFQPDGTVSAWNGNQKGFWNTIGWEARWRRTGDQITIRTDRNWDFVGNLEGDTLRGTMTIRNYPDRTETTTEMVWRREPPPPRP